jgi:predicted ATPase
MVQRLEKIHIEGYKSIKEMDLEIRNLNVLIGANGSGKSNFISLFKFLRNVIEQRLQYYVRYSSANRILHYGSQETKLMTISLDFSPNLYKVSFTPSLNDGLFIEKEEIAFWNKSYGQPLWTRLATAQIESEIEKASSQYPAAKYVYNFLNSWRVYHFHDTSDTALVKKKNKINDNLFLREDASNLAAFLYRMKIESPKHYARIVKTIQLVVPLFKDFLLRPDLVNGEVIQLEWVSKKTDYIFSGSDLSDGSLRFICLATMLLQPKRPDLILLDEPELGLHPSAITILASLIRKASHESQLIIATQSADLISLFDAEHIIVAENNDGISQYKRLDMAQLSYWLNEYSSEGPMAQKYTLGEIWNKNIIGGQP